MMLTSHPYDRIASFYDVLTAVAEDPARHAGLDRLAVVAGERILEIGCGTGRLLPKLGKLVQPHGRVDAVDLSEGMLRVARKRLQRSHSENVRLAQADARQLPYADRTFDGVYLSFTLELFDPPDIQRVLAECRRVLRLDGRMVVVASSKEHPAPKTQRLYEWAHRHFPTVIDCRPIRVVEMLEESGFQVETEDLRMLPIPLRIVRARPIGI